MAGKIGRISDNTQVKGIAEKEKGYILKNIDSDLDNGVVKLNFTQGNYIEAKTKKINNKRKTDYSFGNATATSLFEDNDKNSRFIEKNILKNHQIDKFLRFQNSKERYEALSVFWDTKNESELYYGLVIVSEEISKYYDALKTEEEKLSFEIDNLSLNAGAIKEIENLIYTINTFENKKLLSWSDEEYNTLYQAASKYKSNNEMVLIENRKKIDEIIEFSKEYQRVYQKSVIELNRKTNIDLPKLLKFKETFLRIATLRKKEKEINKKLIELNNILIDISYLEEKQAYVRKLEKSLKKHESNLLDLQNYRLKIDNENLDKLLTRTSLNNLLNQFNKNLADYNNKISLIKDIRNQTKNRLNTNTLIEEQVKLIDKNNTEKISLKEMRLLKEVLKLNISLDINETFRNLDQLTQKNKNLEQNLIRYNSIRGNLKVLNEELHLIKNKVEKTINLGTAIDKLKELSIDLISQNDLNVCPVCNNKFEDYKSLLDKVQSEFKRSNELIQLELKLSVVQKKVEDSHNEMLRLKSLILEEISEQLNIINESINNLEISIEERDKELNKINIEIIAEEENKNTLFANLSKLNLNVDKIDDKLITNLNEIEEKIQSDIDYNDLKLNKVSLEISNINNKVGENNNSLLLTEKKLAIVKLEIDKIDGNPIWKEYKKIKSKYENIDLMKKETTQKINSMQIQNEELIKMTFDLELQVRDIEESIIDNKIEQSKIESRILGDVLARLDKECLALLNTETYVESKFLEEKENLTIRMNNLLKMNDAVTYILDILKSHLENRYLLEKKEKIILLQKDLNSVMKKRDYIMDLKIEAYNHIKKKIKKTFNEESINQIFRLLDPLETSPRVSFELDEKNAESLGMDVFLVNELKKESNAPILYLSSAQVNILSLSIFLASAIENVETFNTILLDDPLQHLDGMNILSFIDLIRIIAFSLDIQIIISTHNKTFFELCKKKIPSEYCSSKYIDLSPKN